VEYLVVLVVVKKKGFLDFLSIKMSVQKSSHVFCPFSGTRELGTTIGGCKCKGVL